MDLFKNCFVVTKLYGTGWKEKYEYWINVGVSEKLGILRKGQFYDSLETSWCR